MQFENFTCIFLTIFGQFIRRPRRSRIIQRQKR